MNKKLIKVIKIMTLIAAIMIGFVIEAAIADSEIFKKYALITIAKQQGATEFIITDESVRFKDNIKNLYVTIYDYDYGIRELSGK